jgi:hypothetical protein
MKTKLIYVSIFLLSFWLLGCIDEYQAANPAPRKDGPAVFVSEAPANNIKSTRTDGSEVIYVPFGQTMTFDVNVADAPGLIDSAFVSLDVEGRGTAEIDMPSFNAVRGKDKGTFQVKYTAADVNTGFVNLSIVVKDAQNIRNESGFITKAGKESTAFTATLRSIACIPEIDLAGTWTTVASGDDSEDVDGDGTFDYTNLTSSITFTINVTAASVNVENASVVRISDASFGLYGYQGFTGPRGRITFCGNSITAYQAIDNASHAITMTGQINSDGTLTINWSNVFGDSGVVTLTKQ